MILGNVGRPNFPIDCPRTESEPLLLLWADGLRVDFAGKYPERSQTFSDSAWRLGRLGKLSRGSRMRGIAGEF